MSKQKDQDKAPNSGVGVDAIVSGESDTLTPEQIANWRRVLAGIFGGYALLVPAEEIQAIRDAMQAKLNRQESR